ncbi:peptidyl-tRNA hydrolase, mitochondrial isoform X1 [Curcuma longa]|uniref:peptidyl-tRNA hydrolase, mitochondrial isoform X1 n=1 Tax=Curcuma longa TaxID=136217 RepID=UPI003D9DEBB0
MSPYKSMFLHCKLLRRSFCTTASSSSCVKPWLLIGLGNPGEKYQGTRHNVGFDMMDAFAQAQGIPMPSIHFKALFGEGMVGDTPVLLAKPQTYMNLSGESTGPLAAYYKLPLNRIIVMYDDMDLPCGVLRIQPKGGHQRHNGLKNVIYHFRGNREFGRLRIGIGRPPGQMDPKAFQLQKFNKTARERIDVALQEGVDILKTLLAKGLTECVRSTNTNQKYKHLRLQNLPVVVWWFIYI